MPGMGPAISVLVGLICAEIIWTLLLRAVVPRLPLSASWRARIWRWSIAFAIVYALFMFIVMVTLVGEG